MKVYTSVKDLVHVKLDNHRGMLEVCNAFDIKDELKTRGYKFDGKAWTKQVTAETLAEELQFLDSKAAIQAYSTLDYVLIAGAISGLPARERRLRNGEWDTTYAYDKDMLKLFLGDIDIDEATRRAIYDKLCADKNFAQKSFEDRTESCRWNLLYRGGLINEDE